MNIDVNWLAAVFPQLKNFKLLGEGGQKWVFCCSHNSYGNVVLKLIKPGAEGRLDREIEATKRVPSSAPKIYEVQVVESQIGQVIAIIEQYIKGTTLSEAISVGPLNQQQLLSLARDLLSGAAEAETQKIVHRDIKPANVIIDDYGKAWLLDFGIARILDMDSKTRTDATFGPHSPGYSAPEQFRNRKLDIDGRTDLFSVGITLYEAVTGENPFIKDARDRMEILHRVEQLQLPKVKLDWDKDDEFANFISSLTQKYNHQRPGSCHEAFEWVEEIYEKYGGE